MRILTVLSFSLALVLSSASYAGDGGEGDEEFCPDLWYKRNAIFDARGFCFTGAKARRTFDNSDCYTSNPRLSRSEQREVARIKRKERNLGCTPNGNSAPG